MLNKLVTYRSKTQFYWPTPDPANPTVPCYMHSEKPSLSFLSSSKNHKSGLTTFGFSSSGMWLVPSLSEGGHPKKGYEPDQTEGRVSYFICTEQKESFPSACVSLT